MRSRKLLMLNVLPLLGAACIQGDDTTVTSDSAAGVAAASSADAIDVRRVIDSMNVRMVEAIKRGDTVAIAENYAEDAVMMMANSESWRGRDAIRHGFAGMLSQMPVKEFNAQAQDVTVGGDIAVETGAFEITMQPKSGPEVKDKGRYIVVWKRQPNGSWKIVRDITNSELPPRS